jgi:hypothetical protein
MRWPLNSTVWKEFDAGKIFRHEIHGSFRVSKRPTFIHSAVTYETYDVLLRAEDEPPFTTR